MSTSIDPRALVSPRQNSATTFPSGRSPSSKMTSVIGDGTVIDANALIGIRCAHRQGLPDPSWGGGGARSPGPEIRGRTDHAAKSATGPSSGNTPRSTGARARGADHYRERLLPHGLYACGPRLRASATMSSWRMRRCLRAIASSRTGSSIGGVTPVHQFVRIGQHAMIGGGLRVPKDVPPYVLAGNDPLVCEGLNSIGLRRRGFQPAVDRRAGQGLPAAVSREAQRLAGAWPGSKRTPS